jgi:hypothetical protein
MITCSAILKANTRLTLYQFKNATTRKTIMPSSFRQKFFFHEQKRDGELTIPIHGVSWGIMNSPSFLVLSIIYQNLLVFFQATFYWLEIIFTVAWV